MRAVRFDIFGLKPCPTCDRRLPPAAFNVDRHLVSGKSSSCTECLNAARKAIYHRDVQRSRRRWLDAKARRGVAHDRAVARVKAARLKSEMIAAYGGVCACCEEWRQPFLTIEHIRKNGGHHRKYMRGATFYYVLKKQGWPKNDYELLCLNCNIASYRQPCPHILEAAARALCA